MYRGKAHNLLLTSKYKYLKHYNFLPFKINIRWNPEIHNFLYNSRSQSHLYLYAKIQVCYRNNIRYLHIFKAVNTVLCVTI